MDSERLSKQRSLAFHKAIAARLRADPSLLEEARVRLDRWAKRGSRSTHLIDRWGEILSHDLGDLLDLLEDPGDEATGLRHASPFAGMLDPKERWRIWREVRDSMGADAQ